MTAGRVPDERLAHRIEGGHWLMFDWGQIVGCHCGFVADMETDSGYGDSVLDHFEDVVRAEERYAALTEAVKHLHGLDLAARIVADLRDGAR